MENKTDSHCFGQTKFRLYNTKHRFLDCWYEGGLFSNWSPDEAF